MLKMGIIGVRTFVGKWDEIEVGDKYEISFTDVVEFQTLFNAQQGGMMLVGTLLGDWVEDVTDIFDLKFTVSKDSAYWKAYFQTTGGLKAI